MLSHIYTIFYLFGDIEKCLVSFNQVCVVLSRRRFIVFIPRYASEQVMVPEMRARVLFRPNTKLAEEAKANRHWFG